MPTILRKRNNRIFGWRKNYYEDGSVYYEPQTRIYPDERSRTGDRVKGFRRLIQTGGNATSDFSAYDNKNSVTPGYSYYTRTNTATGKVYREEFVGCYFTALYNSTEWDNTKCGVTKAEAQALSRLYGRIREVRTQMSGPIFLGELRENIRMLRRPAATIRDRLGGYISTLTKGKGRTNHKHLQKMISDTWLEYAFGMAPLLNDSRDAAIACARLINNQRRARIAAYGKDQQFFDTGTEIGSAGTFRRKTRLNKVEVKYIAGIKSKVPATVTVKDVFGFNLQEFVPTVWNLLPWSFVVDYFANVGDILEALTQDVSDVAWICRLERHTGVTTLYNVLDTKAKLVPENGYAKEAVSTPETRTYTQTSVLRSKVINLNIPPLVFELPNVRQSFNLAALAASVRRVLS